MQIENVVRDRGQLVAEDYKLFLGWYKPENVGFVAVAIINLVAE